MANSSSRENGRTHAEAASGPSWTAPLLWALAGGTIVNALWMLAAPLHWYERLPAGVPDFGSYNPHFVRDLGCAFFTVGVAMAMAARDRGRRRLLTGFALLFFGAHALIHVYDAGVGHVGRHHFVLDLPLTYLPALLLALVLWATPRDAAREK